MGYYTDFGLDIYPDAGHEDEVKLLKEDILKLSGENDDIDILFESGSVHATLYLLDNWLEEACCNYPHLLVRLTGQGEDGFSWELRCRGDICEHQYPKIPPFEHKELLTEEELKLS